MSLEYGSSNFREIDRDLAQVESWLRKRGVNLENTRFQHIRKNVNTISSYFGQGRIKEIFSVCDQETVVASLTDAIPFIDIHNAFKNQKPHQDIPKQSLVKAVGGEFLAKNEKASMQTNEARNFLFELELAAVLKMKGFDILNFDDILFDLENAKCNVQCKRPMSSRNLRSCVEEAVGQVQSRCNQCRDGVGRGIIAISVDKVLETDRRIIHAETPGALEDIVNNMLMNLFKQHMNVWKIVDQRILVIILFMKYVTVVKTTGNLSLGRQSLVYVLVSDSGVELMDRHRISVLKNKLSVAN